MKRDLRQAADSSVSRGREWHGVSPRVISPRIALERIALERIALERIASERIASEHGVRLRLPLRLLNEILPRVILPRV
jgi:hypothetical protein